MPFHNHVESVREYFTKYYPDDKKAMTAQKLTSPSEFIDMPTLEKMWSSIEKANNDKYEFATADNLWVFCFISSVYRASHFPPYYYYSRKERADVAQEIQKLTKRLTGLLQRNELDHHIIHLDNKIWNGFYIFEQFGESNQAGIENDELNKVKFSEILSRISEQATEEISYAYTDAKASRRFKAIRFIRELASSNMEAFGKPLHSVLVSATLAIFNENFEESDICNLLNRRTELEDKSDVVSRLSELHPSEYALQRGAEADKLRIHVSELDEIVEDYKKQVPLQSR